MSLIVGAAEPVADTVVIARLQPAAKLPRSPGPSSNTYNDHAPLGTTPLNTDNGAVYGPAGAGAGNVSSSPVSPGSTLLGLYVPATIVPVAVSAVAAASDSVTVTLLKSADPPTSDKIIA